MGKYISQNTKDEILAAVKAGMKVSDAAMQHKVGIKAIYRWLRETADGSGTSILEMNRLRRENAELKEIIGLLTLERERSKKNQLRS